MSLDADDGRRPLPSPPDRTGDERTTLVQFLEYFRAILVRKYQGLDPDDRVTRLGGSTLTIAGLVKHMAFVEDVWFSHRFAGIDDVEPWTSAPWDRDPDWEFTTAIHDSEAELLHLFDAACDRSRAVLAQVGSLDETAELRSADDPPASMRWILVHMIEEYARHCGHADLLREAVDGVVGD